MIECGGEVLLEVEVVVSRFAEEVEIFNWKKKLLLPRPFEPETTTTSTPKAARSGESSASADT